MANPNFANRTLFHGDNLDFLRAIDSDTIDLIATDPPFNKGRDFHATPSSLTAGSSFQDRWRWDEDVHQDWIDAITDEHPKLWRAIEAARYTHSDAMGAFCCFLGIRLLAMHRILKPTGSIYLHCDDTADYYIRMLMDAIFGAKHFRNAITWERMQGNKKSTKKFGRTSDRIVFYVKSEEADSIFKMQYKSGDPSHYKYDDNDGRGLYHKDNTAAPADSPRCKFTFKGYPCPPKGWRYTLETMQQLDRDGLLAYPAKPNGRIMRKRYLSDYKGVAINDIWNDINCLRPVSPETVGYPTQKPIALYSRIIQASCPEGGWVLDPFAGCATTCVAAERLQRNWAGIDLWDAAPEVIEKRMKKECDWLCGGEVILTDHIPARTDDGAVATASTFAVPTSTGQKRASMTRAQMVDALIERDGLVCRGCDWVPHHKRYLQVDHIVPKTDNGSNELPNRALLCGPCNLEKSNTLTLSGLRKANKKAGTMFS